MFFDEIDKELRSISKKCLPQLKEIKRNFFDYYKQLESIDNQVLALLLQAAIEKLDKLHNVGDYGIDERDAKDILCDQEFIFEDLVDMVIDDYELFYNEVKYVN